MQIDRLRRIIEYSKENKAEISSKVRAFYYYAGISVDREILNIMQIARAMFYKKRYLTLEFPIADKEIGALCCRGDCRGYVVLNSSLPRVSLNFAVCHEIYHVFYPSESGCAKIDFASENWYEQDDELSANLFAGMLLMPEASFTAAFEQFQIDSGGDTLDTIIRLIHYFQAPYMAVVIRSIELGLLKENSSIAEFLRVDDFDVRKRTQALWLDESILEATKKDDFSRIKSEVSRLGAEYVAEEYLSEWMLRKVLDNMQTHYRAIKEA